METLLSRTGLGLFPHGADTQFVGGLGNCAMTIDELFLMCQGGDSVSSPSVDHQPRYAPRVHPSLSWPVSAYLGGAAIRGG